MKFFLWQIRQNQIVRDNNNIVFNPTEITNVDFVLNSENPTVENGVTDEGYLDDGIDHISVVRKKKWRFQW